MVKRYEFYTDHGPCEATESNAGEFVEYDEYLTLEEAHVELARTLADLKADIRNMLASVNRLVE